jgi:hypothetical protein
LPPRPDRRATGRSPSRARRAQRSKSIPTWNQWYALGRRSCRARAFRNDPPTKLPRSMVASHAWQQYNRRGVPVGVPGGGGRIRQRLRFSSASMILGRQHEVSSHVRRNRQREHPRRAGEPAGQTDRRVQRPLHSHRVIQPAQGCCNGVAADRRPSRHRHTATPPAPR